MAEAVRIEPIDIEEEVRSSFLDYAMSVIVSRALPDVRDGLKPVHRRILWSMLEQGIRPDRPTKKSARVVGDVMGKYHPHGDQAIYDSLVRMAQPWSLRNPLIDGQGNFGSIEGHPAGAQRYCVVGDTRVRTSEGTARIRDLVPGATPNSDNPIDIKVLGRGGRLARAEMLFHSGPHPTLRLLTREGYELTGTENHPVLCLVSVLGVPLLLWKLLSEVRPGDRVAISRHPHEELGILTEEQEHLAVLAGGFVSEGWFSAGRAGFNNADPEYFGRVLAAYDAIVGGARYVYSSRRFASGTLIHELDVQRIDALERSPLGELKGQRSADKEIPSFVWDAPPAFKALFLRSLYEGDGSVSLSPRNSIQISYSTRSNQLAREVQQLLLEFGVISRVHRVPSGEIKVGIYNRREARLFAARIGFLGRKQRRLEKALAELPSSPGLRSRDRVPFVAAYLRAEGAARWTERDWLRRHNLDAAERWDTEREEIHKRVTSREARLIVEPLVDGSLYYATVAAVQDAGIQDVYSVRVDSEDHSFLTEGFVSHNTECRLGPMAMELLRDIGAETVDDQPNYDGEEREPIVLPARFPNLLVNGSAGIAVGMATNMPPHNLGEIIDAVVATIDDPDVTPARLERIVKGPDFPTGGVVMGKDGIKDYFRTGRGSIKMRGTVTIEEDSKGRQKIVITQVPYQVNPSNVAVKVAELAEARRLPEVAGGKKGIRNESSNRSGMRIVIELARNANPHIALNKIYKMTQLQESFGVINLALVDGVPRTLGLVDLIKHYIDHQVEVVTRRTRYELRKAEERDHIVEGLLIALANLDAVIKIIRGSADTEEARTKLMRRFKLSEIQANHILDMPLRRLTRLEREKLEEEHRELLATIKRLKALLKDPKKLRGVIKTELTEIREKYADERRTEIKADEGEIDLEDLITEQDVVLTVTRAGYVKRLPVETYRRQGRGGKGIRGTNLKEEDVVAHAFTTTTRHWLLFFTNSGKVYRVKAHEVPEGTRTARGTYAANLPGVSLTSDEKIAAVIPLKTYEDAKYLIFATKNGIVKKTSLAEYDSPRTGLAAINLRKKDELIGVKLTNGKDDVIMVSRGGQAVRFKEKLARPMGRQTGGVIGMRLRPKDVVISMDLASQGEEVVTLTQAGYGKRTSLKEYEPKGRGIYGVVTHKLTSKTGNVAGAFVGSKEQDVFVISTTGLVVRVSAGDIRRTGRPSQGVRVMKFDNKTKVAAVAPVIMQVEGPEPE